MGPSSVSTRRNWELVSSGIPGFDEIVAGGFPKGRCVVVYGDPGSGKTTFAIQFLHNGITQFNEPGVYVTLTEDPDEIRQNMSNFGWNIQKLEHEKKLHILDVRPVTTTEGGLIAPVEDLFKGEVLPFSHVARLIVDKVKKYKAKRVAVDSLTVLTMQYVNRFYVRQGLLGFIQTLSAQDCTSLLLVEALKEEKHAPLEFALAPAVITIRYQLKGDTMFRSIQVQKMRGVKHGEKVYGMEIGDTGVMIHPIPLLSERQM